MNKHSERRRARTRLALRHSILAASVMLAMSAMAQDAETNKKEDAKLEKVEVIGSRARAHTVTETASAVDVVTRAAIDSAGSQELGQILQNLEPSFNFSRTFISDGTDIIRPATLRSLGPDQVLVLINGKRRHQQALVNVQQTIGRGSAGTDINAIPVSMIKRVEVLRDGAAAQYGSDAIAGVINIILKDQTDYTDVSAQGGKTFAGDGDTNSFSANTGIELANGGFLNLTGEYRNRLETNRAGKDLLRVDPPRVTQRIGDSDATDEYVWMNGGLDIGGGQLYWFGGGSHRNGDSSGFFRSAGDGRTVPALYPNGFLPNIQTTVNDSSIVVGYKAPMAHGWEWDASLNYGRSFFGFHEANTVNVSWYYEPKPGGGIFAESPTSADTGNLIFDQSAFNLDFHGPVEWGMGNGPLYLGTGMEYRHDGYQVEAGDPVSYTYGRSNNRNIVILNQGGTIAAPGAQGFPGFTPETAIDKGRHNIALYLDAESQLTQQLLAGAAVRYEDYSDFGSTVTGKLSLRYDFSEMFAVRGTISNGFRAPSVQQEFYSQVSTNLNAAGVLTDTLTARQGSAVTRAFGIDDLKEETSTNYTLGFVFRPSAAWSFTADFYRIDINDRIVFSSNIAPESAAACTTAAGCPIKQILDPLGVGQVLFFTNAIDTRTYGLDLVADYTTTLSNGDQLDLSAAMNFNDTSVEKRRSQSAILPPAALFDDTQVTLIERGQPRAHHVLSADLTHADWLFNARANYYGAVEGQGFTPGTIQRWDAKWLFDLSAKYKVTDAFSVTVGADNVFDTYPTKWDKEKAFPFPQLGFTYCWETCPFGINGGYWYVRADYRF